MGHKEDHPDCYDEHGRPLFDVGDIYGAAVGDSVPVGDEHLVQVKLPVPLFIVKENEYYDEAWYTLAAFTDKAKALQYIENRERELRAGFVGDDEEFYNWYTHTIQETKLY